MTDRDLTDLLERLGDRVDISPPPVAAMTRAADRTRRRRTAWVVGSAAAAVAVVAAGTQVVGGGLTDGRESHPPATRPIPAGTHLVGIGHAAIAVPKEWRRNNVVCGQPAGDTYVIDVSSIGRCLMLLYPADVDAVWLFDGQGEFKGGDDIEIDGMPAKRTPTTCSSGQAEGADLTCSASVYVPSEDVRFKASSSTSRERVDEILDEVRILDDEVGVPAFGGASDELYERRLSELGLIMVKKWRSQQGPAGRMLDVQPEPGTVVAPGTQVTVTVNRPRLSADRLELGLTAFRAEATSNDPPHTELGDAQVRAGATVQLRLGERVFFHRRGDIRGLYAADVDGTSLDIKHQPAGDPYPRYADAVRAGTTTVRLTFTTGGKTIEIGSITFVVRS